MKRRKAAPVLVPADLVASVRKWFPGETGTDTERVAAVLRAAIASAEWAQVRAETETEAQSEREAKLTAKLNEVRAKWGVKP